MLLGNVHCNWILKMSLFLNPIFTQQYDTITLEHMDRWCIVWWSAPLGAVTIRFLITSNFVPTADVNWKMFMAKKSVQAINAEQ